MNKYILFVFLIYLASSSLVAQTTTIVYQASANDFANPERGFYRYSETRSSNYTPLDQSTLEGYRQLHTPPTANYSIYSTLVFRYFFLEDFKNSNISQDYLDNMQADFDVARQAGVKLIPRFTYTDEVNGTGCPNWICPPYGDAPKSWVLAHINQLQPLLQNNIDVIAAVQMGFIGVWGENYYTDYFGDASQSSPGKLLDSNWIDRIDVLNALLDVVPLERMVQVRYPQMKQRTVYGINAPTNSNALTISEAFGGTNKARIGFHNDCLLSNDDDFGTYTDYGNSSSPTMSDTTNLKPYLASDSKFVVVGGETCTDSYSPQNDCSNTSSSAFADLELNRMHYSYLNSQYNNDVNNDWEDGGCMDEIKQRLGYRFELQDGMFSDAAQPNQVIDIELDLRNTGYASPYNERGVELIFRNVATSEIWFVALDDDPRHWFANNLNHTISDTLCIPNEIPLGTYELLLHLPDPMPNLHGVPEYSIRLANLLPNGNDVWESETGYNKLGHFLEVDNVTNNSQCNGEITLSPLLSPLPVDLINFQAISGNEKIKLEWTTSAEVNSAGFYLERSNSSNSFTRLTWIESKGEPDMLSSYSYMDKNVEQNKDYYYRLAQKDHDGTITYSKVVSGKILNNGYDKPIRIYPNPTQNTLTIDYGNSSSLGMDFKILIRNSMGEKVDYKTINNNTINISSLPKGIYFIEISSSAEKILRKLIKN